MRQGSTLHRYCCDSCLESFITPRGFKNHAERDHTWETPDERPQAVENPVMVDG